MKNSVLFITLILLSGSIFAQSSTIAPGSVLPQMTTTQRTALANPVNGMMVYDTGTSSYWFYQQSAWSELPKGGSTANYWQLDGLGGNEIKNTNSGGFWSANPVGLISSSSNTSNPPAAPINGNGTRLMWIPSRSAFRAGSVDSNFKSWDADSIGLFSFATGLSTKAIGKYSVALNVDVQARGLASVAMGNSTKASGASSTAMGAFTNASGKSSTTLGQNTKASGEYSTAMGLNTSAKAVGSIVVGLRNDNSDNPAPNIEAPNDRIFQIGNGSDVVLSENWPTSNAMTVLRNANTGINTTEPEAMLHVNGFTKLGDDAPKIKVKKLTGTTHATQGNKAFLTHSLDSDKILSVEVLVEYETNDHRYVPASYTVEPNYEFHHYTSEDYVVVWTKAGNSSDILSKPIKVLITYEE